MSESNNLTNPHNGTIIYNGELSVTKGNHTGMPQKTESYLPGDERGHINASSLNGSNAKDNVVPQAKDLNHGAYYHMEQGERNVLTQGGSIQSEKIAYTNAQPGARPDTFMVNDSITYANGQQAELHFSFTNMSYEQQENLNQELNLHVDMLDALPNPGDTLRESMTPEEYAELMELTDLELPDIKTEYEECISYTPADEKEITEDEEMIEEVSTEETAIEGALDQESNIEIEGSIDDGGESIDTDMDISDSDDGISM